MNEESARNFTDALGKVSVGAWELILEGEKLGVPKALGLTKEEWSAELAQAGAYRRLTVEQRRESVRELSEQGVGQRAIARALGVSQPTVRRDLAELTAGDTDVSPAEAESRDGTGPAAAADDTDVSSADSSDSTDIGRIEPPVDSNDRTDVGTTEPPTGLSDVGQTVDDPDADKTPEELLDEARELEQERDKPAPPRWPGHLQHAVEALKGLEVAIQMDRRRGQFAPTREDEELLAECTRSVLDLIREDRRQGGRIVSIR